ncbi:hypothetical protein B566_EDAN011017, partial [Ephemera danica]
MKITSAAVAGTMCAGGRFQMLKDICIAIVMTIMTSATYQSQTVTLSPYWEKAALLERKNTNERRRVAAIIGMRTGKCVFIGVRNKCCCICARASNKGQNPIEHLCYKNWDSSSTAMESDIVVQGLLISEVKHKLRYVKLVANGDSSTYKRISEANPYKSIVVEKTECKSNILRHLTGRHTELSAPKRGQPKFGDTASIKLVGSQKNLALRDRIQLMQRDIEITALNYFGDHGKCDSYFCTGEQRNLIIAKFISGKSFNCTQRNSYSDRCNMAVVSHNTHKTFYSLHKSMCKSSPGYH